MNIHHTNTDRTALAPSVAVVLSLLFVNVYGIVVCDSMFVVRCVFRMAYGVWCVVCVCVLCVVCSVCSACCVLCVVLCCVWMSCVLCGEWCVVCVCCCTFILLVIKLVVCCDDGLTGLSHSGPSSL